MRKIEPVVVGLIAVILLVSCSGKEIPDASNKLSFPELSDDQTTLIYDKLKGLPEGVKVSIGIVANGKTNYIGVARLEGALRSVDLKDNVYEIGPITKVFTSTLLANAVLENKVSLDGFVNEQYDFPFKNDKKISYLSLSNHTSGLSRLPTNVSFLERLSTARDPYKDYDQLKLDQYLKQELEIKKTPTPKSVYSNLGASLLGNALGSVYDKSYSDLIQEKIASRYDLKTLTTSHEDVQDRLIGGLDAYGNPTSNWHFKVVAPAGALLSDVVGLVGFMKAHFNEGNEELSLSRKRTYQDPNLDIALGWMVTKADSIYWHNGGTGGYRSMFAMLPEKEKGVVILSNISSSNKKAGHIDQLALELLRDLKEE